MQYAGVDIFVHVLTSGFWPSYPISAAALPDEMACSNSNNSKYFEISHAGVDIFVHVLTSGFWPSYPISEAALPEEMATYQAVFREFYLKKHSGRQLVWHNSLGTCVLKVRQGDGLRSGIVFGNLVVQRLRVFFSTQHRVHGPAIVGVVRARSATGDEALRDIVFAVLVVFTTQDCKHDQCNTPLHVLPGRHTLHENV